MRHGGKREWHGNGKSGQTEEKNGRCSHLQRGGEGDGGGAEAPGPPHLGLAQVAAPAGPTRRRGDPPAGRSSGRAAGAVFRVLSGGEGAVTKRLPSAGSHSAAAGATNEREGGSRQRRGAPASRTGKTQETLGWSYAQLNTLEHSLLAWSSWYTKTSAVINNFHIKYTQHFDIHVFAPNKTILSIILPALPLSNHNNNVHPNRISFQKYGQVGRYTGNDLSGLFYTTRQFIRHRRSEGRHHLED